MQEVIDEVDLRVAIPDGLSQYRYFVDHMDDTLPGRKVNNALSAVKRTAGEFVVYRQGLFETVSIAVEGEFGDLDDRKTERISLALTKALEPDGKHLEGRSRPALIPLPVGSTQAAKAKSLFKLLKQTDTNDGLIKRFRRLSIAQANLRSALTPKALVRRMVQDGECEVCSQTPLPVPERDTVDGTGMNETTGIGVKK